jgi:radial spoke head protein 4A
MEQRGTILLLKLLLLKEVIVLIIFLEKKDDSPADLTIEPRTNEKGVNKYMYFVCSDLTLGDWVELDDVKPSQLIAARKITYTFTGELTKKIITNPHFPGLEKDYLRCQIARISHNSTIIPLTPAINGQQPQWKIPNPENREIEKNEEAKTIRIQDVINIKNWVHFIPGLLKEGRTVHMEREPPEGVDPDEFKKQIVAKDKFDDLLASIDNDKKLTSSIPNIKIPAWKLQFLYDDKVYINPNIKIDLESDPEQKKDNTVNYTIVCVKSLRWPGAIVVRFRGEIYNFYFGWGKKFCDTGMDEKFVFKDFEVIQTDLDELDVFPEPNSPPHELEKVEMGGDPVVADP